MSKLKKLLKNKGYAKIPLVLGDTNHLEVTARINGVSGRFILDTGASNTCVGVDKAGYFKLVSKDSEIKAAGAGATDMDTLVSVKNKIEMGGWKKAKQQIVVFDLVHVNEALKAHKSLPVDGIIGADILIKCKAVIDYASRNLFLKNKK
ncbi:retropepsin-like aspartic protease [Eudoraea adriatica]|uniref:retropepsin-like aspartic protease n=1 Tax=Eudoraea adriatica TaxID=446681 RepID=UPI00037156C3|nr:retropepsin-like aspartic protease [Eudoraea adriatica]